MQIAWIETIPFMGMSNGSSYSIVENFNLGWSFFNSIIRVEIMENKPGSFLLSGVHAKQDTCEKTHLVYG